LGGLEPQSEEARLRERIGNTMEDSILLLYRPIVWVSRSQERSEDQLTMPCKKHNTRLAIFEGFLNNSSGMRGYFASLLSLKMKIPEIKVPKIMRQRTCGDFH
jgi:hypothetical protein